MNLNIKKVTVIGANGILGTEISGLFASFGNAIVYMISRDINKSNDAIEKAALSVKALSVKNNLIAKTMDDLQECIKESDLVFESVCENLDIKCKIHKEIDKYVKNTCLIATGTSGLSINKLAECYSENNRENFYGIHFFNPPYSLSLCELIPSKYNYLKNESIKELKKYLEKKLYRSVIISADEPAFIGNRIGFKFMNEALIYAERYKDMGGIDYIDSILGCYTGRNMPPLETINFVGLDVHKAIVDNIYYNSSDEEKDIFVLPNFVENLIESNKLGIKTGAGLYKEENNKILVYDIKTNDYREKKTYNFEFKNKAIKEFKNGKYIEGFNYIKNDKSLENKICLIFLLKYIIYSIKISKDYGQNITDCDVAMATGFNWIPPIALIKVLGGKKEVLNLCKKYINEDYENIFDNIKESTYDYRKYIKAKD